MVHIGNKKSSSRKRDILITAIIVVAVIFLASIIAALFVLRRRHRRKQRRTSTPNTSSRNSPAKPTVVNQVQRQTSEPLVVKEPSPPSFDITAEFKKGEGGDLNFVKKERERFDLQDLLRASAEILGSGSFGSTYKAIVLNGPAVVVKRFKHMNNVGKEEFFEHMRKLGSLDHPNILPLVAFYFRKDEKLLVYDYVENGSLASHLHGMYSTSYLLPPKV